VRRRRKPPVARIRGQIEAPPSDRDDDSSPEPNTGADGLSLRVDDELDHHGFYAGPLRWTPIASRTGDASSRVH
jgi:hypothetical protein